MLRAVWNGVVLAEAPRTVRLEGNHYFPPESLCCQYFEDSPSRTLCPWKGIASYYNVHAGDEIAFYGHVRIEGEPEPKERAQGGLIARLLGTDRA